MMCVFSRLIFGISDMNTIMQQLIMCLWFSPEQLPIAYSILLFLTKSVRALNDNIAAMVYHHYDSLEVFFWLGLVVCILSFVCALVLTELHSRYIDTAQVKMNEQKVKKDKPKIAIKQSDGSGMASYPKQVWFLIAVTSLGYAVVHAFYPNMSKFLQQNYGLSSVHAGHISSIPYMTGSITVPIFGQVLAYFGEIHYEKFGKCSFGFDRYSDAFVFANSRCSRVVLPPEIGGYPKRGEFCSFALEFIVLSCSSSVEYRVWTRLASYDCGSACEQSGSGQD